MHSNKKKCILLHIFSTLHACKMTYYDFCECCVIKFEQIDWKDWFELIQGNKSNLPTIFNTIFASFKAVYILEFTLSKQILANP